MLTAHCLISNEREMIVLLSENSDKLRNFLDRLNKGCLGCVCVFRVLMLLKDWIGLKAKLVITAGGLGEVDNSIHLNNCISLVVLYQTKCLRAYGRPDDRLTI